MASSANRWEVLDRLAELAVPRLADWCEVCIPVAGTLKAVASAHADPALAQLVRRLGRFDLRISSPAPSARAFRTAAPMLVAEVAAADVGRVPPAAREIIGRLGLCSFMAVPLVGRGRALGVMSLALAAGTRRYGREDLLLAEELVAQAVPAVQHAFDSEEQQQWQATRQPPKTAAGKGGAVRPVDVLLLDPFVLVRESVRLRLEQEADLTVCGEASSLAEAETVTSEPDVIVHEMIFDDCCGPEVLERLRRRFPEAALVVVTRLADPADVPVALSAGAIAYLHKTATSRELLDAIRRAARGEQYVQKSLMPALSTAQTQADSRGLALANRLTPREHQVLELLALGHTNQEIASIMGVAIRTVEAHRSRAKQKLGMNSRADLVLYVTQHQSRDSSGSTKGDSRAHRLPLDEMSK
jgi:two-component system response regulator NreC